MKKFGANMLSQKSFPTRIVEYGAGRANVALCGWPSTPLVFPLPSTLIHLPPDTPTALSDADTDPNTLLLYKSHQKYCPLSHPDKAYSQGPYS
jgi:hypothetical protein